MALKPIELHVRAAVRPPPGSLLLRGSPLTLEQFERDAARTARAFTYRGLPCRGISVELARGDDVDHLLREGRVRSRARVARIALGDALRQGFVVLPTFSLPHYTIVAERADGASLARLLEFALMDVIENHYYQPWKEGS